MKQRMFQRLINRLTILAFFVTLSGAGVFFLFFYYGRGLPDYDYLHGYEPVALNRITAGNGETLRVFASERRIYLPLNRIPTRVINSFLVAEDKHFYYHCGLDIQGILRAAVTNSTQGAWQSRPLGGSTITQQVAKNFLVGNDRTFDRKVREAIMSLRLEFALGKDRILELYLNQIYLGMGAYGVAAAALTYFNKPLEKLSIAETAFLAALPKAPSFYPGQKELTRGKARRNWVLERLHEEGFLTAEELENAQAEPLVIHQGGEDRNQPDYYTEYIRQELVNHFGEDYVEQGGLSIATTLDPALQEIAKKSLRDGLIAYDRRHGWRGPVAQVDFEYSQKDNWQGILEKVVPPPGLGNWSLALVLETAGRDVKIGLREGKRGIIPFHNLTWARRTLPGQLLGPEITHPRDVLEPGDIIAVSLKPDQTYSLEQIPDVTGGIVALDPHTGHILALVGGFDFEKSQYNCATQARRQPGSAFKPFVYLTALEQGYRPETRILDAPVMVSMGGRMGVYAPKNINNRYYGPTPLQSGLIYSRNVMTVRLAQKIGIKRIEKTAKLFGLVEALPPQLAMALGAAETTLLKITTAYGMIANGGRHLLPVFVEQVKDRYGQVIYEAPLQEKKAEEKLEEDETWKDVVFLEKDHENVSALSHISLGKQGEDRVFLARPESIRQLIKMMEGVVQKGTARSLVSLERPIAGKTGTTNDYKDGWFIGFTPDLVVGVFVGFATPRTMGPGESGARVAVPVFKKFMEATLQDEPVRYFE